MKKSWNYDRWRWKFPIHYIEGTPFEVDVFAEELRMQENPELTISFLSMDYKMPDGEKHYYEMDYDPLFKGVYDPRFSNISRDETIRVRVPQMMDLDFEGMVECHAPWGNGLMGKNDWDVRIDQRFLHERLHKGYMPFISVGMDTYHLSWEDKIPVIVKDGFPEAKFILQDLPVNEDGQILALFDPDTQRLSRFPEQFSQIPARMQLAIFPSLLNFDAVGEAIREGKDKFAYVWEHPPYPSKYSTLSSLQDRQTYQMASSALYAYNELKGIKNEDQFKKHNRRGKSQGLPF